LFFLSGHSLVTVDLPAVVRWHAIGIGIGTTRIWLALCQSAGLDFASSIGPAF
jgi:hypothetical protein